MPVRYAVITAERRFSIILNGDVTIRQLLDAFRGLHADAKFDATFDGVIDLRAATSFPTGTEMEGLAKEVSARLSLLGRPRARRALVADSPPSREMARTFQVLWESMGLELEIVHTIGDALTWLTRRAADPNVSR